MLVLDHLGPEWPKENCNNKKNYINKKRWREFEISKQWTLPLVCDLYIIMPIKHKKLGSVSLCRTSIRLYFYFKLLKVRNGIWRPRHKRRVAGPPRISEPLRVTWKSNKLKRGNAIGGPRANEMFPCCYHVISGLGDWSFGEAIRAPISWILINFLTRDQSIRDANTCFNQLLSSQANLGQAMPKIN